MNQALTEKNPIGFITFMESGEKLYLIKQMNKTKSQGQ
jgi:hypothetical protein